MKMAVVVLRSRKLDRRAPLTPECQKKKKNSAPLSPPVQSHNIGPGAKASQLGRKKMPESKHQNRTTWEGSSTQKALLHMRFSVVKKN